MMKLIRGILLLSALIGLAVFAVAATGNNDRDIPTGTLFLEMDAALVPVGPKTCDYAHYPPTCQRFHLKEVLEPASGRLNVTLDNDMKYDVTWSGIGVRLDNGTVIAPRSASSGPTKWMQVYPTMSNISLQGWIDADNSSHLSASDTVTIAGTTVKVQDSYFFMWLSPTE